MVKQGDKVWFKTKDGKLIQGVLKGKHVISGKTKHSPPLDNIHSTLEKARASTWRNRSLPTDKKEKMKTFILTYQDNLPFAKETQKLLKEQWKVNSEIIIGHKIDNDKYTRQGVLMWNWVDFLKPKVMKSKASHIMVLDDDVRFVKNPYDINFNNDVNWIGFRRGRLTNKRPFITGSQAVVFKKDVLKNIDEYFSSKKKKIHLDYGLSRFLTINKDKYKIFQPKLSYAYEQDHESLISLDKWKQYTKPPK
jgi:hypothetical protein